MLRSGINSELFKIVSCPPEWVTKLNEGESSPYFLTNHQGLIKEFLSATTDSVRLVLASRASRQILNHYQMGELEQLRATVQASELLRAIPYPRQTDHSAHTLYLFLLGIYLFFACEPLRKEIASFLDEKDETEELLDRFLFQWVFVSLLHDIGYIFQGRSGSEIRAVDRMFRASTITDLISDASPSIKRAVRKSVTTLELKPFEPIQNPEDMLSVLRQMPWGSVGGSANDIFESFYNYRQSKEEITSSFLENYAYQVASSGYDGFSDGTVDHAVASGLFLFRYSTFWYWLAKENGFEPPSFDDYKKGYSEEDVASACFAAAAHNIIGVHARECGPLKFETNPIMYLGILCDELQKWDRFPAGERHLIDLESFEKYCTDSERIAVVANKDWNRPEVVFRLEEGALADRIAEALKRLDSPETLVKLNPKNGTKASTAGEEKGSEELPAPGTQDSTSEEQ
jgi:hypothetical protein